MAQRGRYRPARGIPVRARCREAHAPCGWRADRQLLGLARRQRPPAVSRLLSYYVAKKGVIALTEALALEVAVDQILVNAIAPGPILAPPGTSEKELEDVAAATPLGRWGGEEAIVQAVIFLLESDFVTGETIRVDGGRHVK